ncbi:uncharacterized protein LOC111639269 [Centruroides sculpturatus]|uniref:uncharacterized protein LOC111639269 n=1 Tax=Centruroides sculpturatus TaxID=218467 RepID=UPI000C6CCC3E|nr:uncharacterized protein LOC111639269 [Centruroides sculpturatus]
MDVYEFNSLDYPEIAPRKKRRLPFAQFLDQQSKILSCKYPFLTRRQIKEKTKELWHKNCLGRETINFKSSTNSYKKNQKVLPDKCHSYKKESVITYSTQNSIKYRGKEKLSTAENIQKKMFGILRKKGENKTSKEFRVTFVEECKSNLQNENPSELFRSSNVDFLTKFSTNDIGVNDKKDNFAGDNTCLNSNFANDNEFEANCESSPENQESLESESDYDVLQTMFSLERFKCKNSDQDILIPNNDKQFEMSIPAFPAIENTDEKNMNRRNESEKHVESNLQKDFQSPKRNISLFADEISQSVDEILSCNSDKLNTAIINISDSELFLSSSENNELEELKTQEIKTKKPFENDPKLKYENEKCNVVDSEINNIINTLEKFGNDDEHSLEDKPETNFKSRSFNIVETGKIPRKNSSKKPKINSSQKKKFVKDHSCSNTKSNEKIRKIRTPRGELSFSSAENDKNSKVLKSKSKEKLKSKSFFDDKLFLETIENEDIITEEKEFNNSPETKVNHSLVNEKKPEKQKIDEIYDFSRDLFTADKLNVKMKQPFVPETEFGSNISSVKALFSHSNSKQEHSEDIVDRFIESMKEIGSILGSSSLLNISEDELNCEDVYSKEVKENELILEPENKENQNSPKNSFENKTLKNLKSKLLNSNLLVKSKIKVQPVFKKHSNKQSDRSKGLLKPRITENLDDDKALSKNFDFEKEDGDSKAKPNLQGGNSIFTSTGAKRKPINTKFQLDFSLDDAFSLSSDDEDPLNLVDSYNENQVENIKFIYFIYIRTLFNDFLIFKKSFSIKFYWKDVDMLRMFCRE